MDTMILATPSSLHLAPPLLRSMSSAMAPRHFTVLSPTVTQFGVDCARWLARTRFADEAGAWLNRLLL
jgi:hypothetical protein